MSYQELVAATIGAVIFVLVVWFLTSLFIVAFEPMTVLP